MKIRRKRNIKHRIRRAASFFMAVCILMVWLASFGSVPMMPEAGAKPVRWSGHYRTVDIDLDGRELWKAAEKATGKEC